MKSSKIGIVRPTPKMTLHLATILKESGLLKPYEKGIYSGYTWNN